MPVVTQPAPRCRCRCRYVLKCRCQCLGAGADVGAVCSAGIDILGAVNLHRHIQPVLFFSRPNIVFQDKFFVLFSILHPIIFHARLRKFFFAVKNKVFTGKIKMLIFFTSCICFTISFLPKSRPKDIFTRVFFAFHCCEFRFFSQASI